eukprot:9185500-Ditylum_brightwellii.AAC.1
MERFGIYMNPTCITEETSEMLGLFYKSHHKFTLRDEAHAELTLCLDLNVPFDIRLHNVRSPSMAFCMKQKQLQSQEAK